MPAEGMIAFGNTGGDKPRPYKGIGYKRGLLVMGRTHPQPIQALNTVGML